MYIPIWLIIAGAIIGYLIYRSKKSNNQNIPGIFKQNFSYRLDISIEPNWNAIYKRLVNPASDKEYEKLIEKKRKDLDKDDTENLFGRRYYFTEYYDSASGLTTRFQRVIGWNGKQRFYPVDEFGDAGYVFDSDSGLSASIDESDEERDKREKLSVEIGEDFIRNDIFDKYIGGPKTGFDYEEENYLFRFPLYEVVNFLFALGQRFHGTERNTIVKWPDEIEKQLDKYGIEYEKFFDYEPKEFDIAEHDKEFYEKWGKPKVSLNSSNRFHSTYFRDKDRTNYSVKLQIFRPGENDRISTV
jgi:hypothetical protein